MTDEEEREEVIRRIKKEVEEDKEKTRLYIEELTKHSTPVERAESVRRDHEAHNMNVSAILRWLVMVPSAVGSFYSSYYIFWFFINGIADLKAINLLDVAGCSLGAAWVYMIVVSVVAPSHKRNAGLLMYILFMAFNAIAIYATIQGIYKGPLVELISAIIGGAIGGTMGLAYIRMKHKS